LNSEELDEQVEDGQTLLAIKRKKKPQPSEWTDYAYDPKYARPYPAYPYYRLTKTDEFACIDEPIFKTRDAKEFLAYMYESHREDAIEWMKNHLKNKMVDKIRLGSTEHISDEGLERMANDEFRELCMHTELRAKQPERMGSIVTEKEGLADFVQGKLGYCPVCGATSENLSGNAKDEFLEKEILSLLKPTKGFTQKYTASWNGRKIDACLKCNIHLHLSHKATFKRLFTSGVFTGGLPQWLATEGYLSRKSMKEELARGMVLPTADKNLKPRDKDLLKWLSKGGE
jgi:hypothetical protein